MRYLRFSEVEMFEFINSDSEYFHIRFSTKSGNEYYKPFKSEESRQDWYVRMFKLDFNNVIFIELTYIK